MVNKANIVHEAEAQRQYVRIQLPLRVKVGTDFYETIDWSNGGVALQWPENLNRDQDTLFVEGKIMKGTLDFPFEEFDMSLPVDMEIRYVDRERHRIGCRFTNLSAQQISMLQYFVGAYISGEVIRVGDVLEVAARNNFTMQRKVQAMDAEKSATGRFFYSLRRRTGLVAVMLVSLFLAAYVVTGLYERFYVVTAKTASIEADMEKVQAPSGGTVFYQKLSEGSKVQKGTPIVMVSSDTGTVSSLDSPCDCYIVSRAFNNYDRVKSFDPLISLVAADAKTFVLASVPFDQAVKLTKGQSAQIYFSGIGKRIKGKVQNILMTSDALEATARVIIVPELSLSAEFVGNPVEVKIDTFQ
ncbi:MAG: PilZ domain-containing protein [Rickettsiales bacterium]|nr:PilZ domain-containing protein [Rickettsiales bacterium]